jgi:hypothetical protein
MVTHPGNPVKTFANPMKLSCHYEWQTGCLRRAEWAAAFWAVSAAVELLPARRTC